MTKFILHKYHLHQCSRNLMRSSIRTMVEKSHYHQLMEQYKASLYSSLDDTSEVRHFIHTLNAQLCTKVSRFWTKLLTPSTTMSKDFCPVKSRSSRNITQGEQATLKALKNNRDLNRNQVS